MRNLSVFFILCAALSGGLFVSCDNPLTESFDPAVYEENACLKTRGDFSIMYYDAAGIVSSPECSLVGIGGTCNIMCFCPAAVTHADVSSGPDSAKAKMEEYYIHIYNSSDDDFWEQQIGKAVMDKWGVSGVVTKVHTFLNTIDYVDFHGTRRSTTYGCIGLFVSSM